ncbi:MAG: superoxide dismutase family protein [Planctomycetes bacterium]|nr:superoxide dismutase family protein [Planctomycetota bacterium]
MTSVRTLALFTGGALLLALSLTASEKPARENERVEPELPKQAIAVLRPTKGQNARGVVLFHQTEDGTRLRGRVMGLAPGKHGFHVHEYGDLRSPDGKSAGGHFNPAGHKHGRPGEAEHHYGDLGNIEANEEGVAMIDLHADWMKLHFIIGRSIVVHSGPDDLESQPSGDAGDRVALGVIGIASEKDARGAAETSARKPSAGSARERRVKE